MLRNSIAEHQSMVSHNAARSQTGLQGAEFSGGEGPCGKWVAVVVSSHYPSDSQPRRAAVALAQAEMQVEVISLREDEYKPRRETGFIA